MNERDREPVIHPSSYVSPEVELGDWSVVRQNVEIHGKGKIGRAAWIDHNVIIGGGQIQYGSLSVGDFLHLGNRSFVNTAARVSIGHEVGIGMESKIFTHGAYLSQLDGFPFKRKPVLIGDNVWLPYAIVLPDIAIGDSVVVGAMSLVNKDLPSGCLAGGVPVKILQRDVFPAKHFPGNSPIPFLQSVVADAKYYGIKQLQVCDNHLRVGNTLFIPHSRVIEGPATHDTEIIKDVFRRRGVRFRYYDNQGVYAGWD